PEQRGKIDQPAADLDLALLLAPCREVLDMHVVEAIAALAARLHRIGAGPERVADVDAEAEPAVARLDRGVPVLRPRPALVLGTVIVDRHVDLVAPGELLDRVERAGIRIDVDQREAGSLRVLERPRDLRRIVRNPQRAAA